MDLEQTAIARFKMASDMSLAHYGQPLIVTTSGGKDSDICLELAKRSGIKYEAQHNLTTADAPQTIYHIRNQFKELELQGVKCTINHPTFKGKRVSMWELIPLKGMPPTRIMRYCCEILKERGGTNRMITTGVRWAESNQRKSRGVYEDKNRNKDKRIILMGDNDDKRRMVERCTMKARTVCNPIIDWQTKDVWDYISSEKMIVNPLYQSGFERVGCIGCPMANKGRYEQFRVFPTYKANYIAAFDRMLIARANAGKSIDQAWRNGESVFRWWMDEDINQMRFEDLEGEYD